MNTTLQKIQNLPRWSKGVLIVLSIYLFLGLFILPPILKARTKKILTTTLHQQIALKRASINPLTFSIHLSDLIIYEQQTPLFQVKRLSLSVSLIDILFNKDITIKKCRVYQPHLQLLVYEDSTFNLSNILPTPKEESPQVQSTTEQSPHLSIKSLIIKEGKISFDDKTAQQKEPLVLNDISFTIDDFSSVTQNNKNNALSLDIITGLGAHILINASVQLAPLAIEGDISLKNVNLQFIDNAFGSYLPFYVASGNLDLSTQFALHAQQKEGKPPVVFSLTDGDATLSSFIIADTTNHTPVISIESFSVKGTQLNTGAPYLKAQSVDFIGDSIIFSLDSTGILSFEKLTDFTQLVEAYPVLKKLGGKFKYYTMDLEEVHLQQQKVAYIDSTFVVPVHHALTHINITLDNMYKTPKGEPQDKDSLFYFTYQSTYNRSGDIVGIGSGTLTPFSINAAIDADSLEVASIQSYLSTILNLHVSKGYLSTNLSLNYPQPSSSALQFNGTIKLHNLVLLNGINDSPFVEVPLVELQKATFQPKPLLIYSQKAILQDLLFITKISTKGLTNIIEMHKTRSPRLIRPQGKKRTPSIIIDTATVKNFTADMQDSSVLFGFTSTFKKLNGTILGFKTSPNAHITYHLSGTLDSNTTIMLDGEAKPFMRHPEFAFNLLGQGINLPSFSPYSATFAGLPIKYGKLKVDLKYYIARDSIWGENDLIIDNVVFGEDVVSQRAIDAPFRLGFKILNNSDGVTTLKAHIEGSLKDPNFKLGNIIWEGIGRAIGKALSSPFRAMARASKAKKMNEVYFVEGTTRITGPGQEKLQKIAEIMKSRDDFNVQLYGVIDDKKEAFFIQQQKLLDTLISLYDTKHLTVESIVNRPDRALLIQAYEQLLHKDWHKEFEQYSKRKLRKFEGGNRVVEKERLRVEFAQEVLEELAENIPLTTTDITTFRRDRAQEVKNVLTQKFHIPQQRLLIVDSLADEPKEGTYVYLNVTLPKKKQTAQ